MDDRVRQRLLDVIDAIEQIHGLLRDKSRTDFVTDRHMRAAFERYLEIASEASKHIPQEIRDAEPSIPWGNVAGIGNHLRHAYHRVDPDILWNTHADGHLDQLFAVCRKLASK